MAKERFDLFHYRKRLPTERDKMSQILNSTTECQIQLIGVMKIQGNG